MLESFFKQAILLVDIFIFLQEHHNNCLCPSIYAELMYGDDEESANGTYKDELLYENINYANKNDF